MKCSPILIPLQPLIFLAGMTPCSRCGKPTDAVEGKTPLCDVCQANLLDHPQASSESTPPLEIDHRGIRLPARTRVGGIIIPQ
jgi:hypothetical protein